VTENLSGVQRTADSRTGESRTARVLRYIPPVSALGTAFVLQIVAVTDVGGGMLADRYGTLYAYIPAALFGLAVASGMEGGAAHLMKLYDKHLLAGDGTFWLRAGMVTYVAASAAGLHWWADARGLPTIMSWLLAGMSASALFLWSRQSRWEHREAMRAAGQIDPALPRLPMAAKLLHPVRWLVTLYLISWEPVTTTTQARARYQAWKDRRDGRTDVVDLEVQQAVFLAEGRLAARRIKVEQELAGQREALYAEVSALRSQAAADLSAVQAEADRIRAEVDLYAQQTRTAADGHAAAVRTETDSLYADAVRLREQADSLKAEARRTADTRPDSPAPVRPTAVNGVRRTAPPVKPEVSVEQLADSLDKRFPDTVPGRPTAIEHLKKVYGSCSNDRARAAIQILASRRESAPADEERSPDAVVA
jgi:hypothetical protein